MAALAERMETQLKRGGHAIFIVGEQDRRSSGAYPSEELAAIMANNAPSLRLVQILADEIPDIHRARRHKAGVKQEHFLVYRKGAHA